MENKQQDHFYDNEIKNRQTGQHEQVAEILFTVVSLGLVFMVIATILYLSGSEPGTRIAYACGGPTPTPYPWGRSPTDAEWAVLSANHPNLVRADVRITGDSSPYYNCFAYSVGETNEVITDLTIDILFGDGNGNCTASEMDAFYDLYDYESCTQGEAEIRVYFSHQSGNFTHAEIKYSQGNDIWESKMGISCRITCPNGQLSDDHYGYPVYFYKKKN